jgi:hypothetical protein
MQRKDSIQMTLNPPTSSHVPATDGIPIVAWQYVNAATRLSPFPDWQLLIGTVVEIRRHGQLIGTGLVDNATSSGDIVWIAADGINGRTMIVKAEGYDLSITPAQLQAQKHFREEVT